MYKVGELVKYIYPFERIRIGEIIAIRKGLFSKIYYIESENKVYYNRVREKDILCKVGGGDNEK